MATISTTKNTTDATPVVIYSYPVAEGSCLQAQAQYTCYKSDFSLGATGNLTASFMRAAGGNVARISGADPIGLDGIIQGNFSTPQPALDLVANTSTQSVDVTLTGKAATNITWKITLDI